MNFSDSPLNCIFESENFKFPFRTENGLTRSTEMQKIKLKKILGNLLDMLQKLKMNGMVI